MSKKNPRFYIHTLGCKVNQYDSEKMRTHLLRRGFTSIPAEEEGADLIIVNTCSVTAESDRKGRQAIRKLIRRHPQARVMVTGCYAERFPDRLQRIEGVDHVVAIEAQESWLNQLTDDLGWGCEDQDALWGQTEGIETFFEHTRAFLKIQDGCDLQCTYCSIPLSRGRARSRRIPEIVEEARNLADRGYPEIVICGICLGNFGLDTGETLAELIRRMAPIPNLKRIRISSFEPQNLTDAFFAAIADCGEVVCPHLHLPLQSGSDRILRRMKRPYQMDYYRERIEKARSMIPHFEVTTDLMAGFPGETDADFQASLAAIRDCRFTKVHSFRYSVREDTPAARLPDPVSPQVSEERRQGIDQLALFIAREQKQSYVGQIVPVLIETEEEGLYTGFTSNYIRARFHASGPVARGEIVPIRFTALKNGVLVGEATP
ncbi:MAG: tRNA (N(6)-L-threonylcarbamoyladenosine(37)-C(2))-methylthiotransferase MtaB [bacterium]|jgi:threonylcarbamoyladenosine tRNA methylthiotransferase MtaB|nr:tRNA (N(6)-L-threonylcarbamoyladenosine(37)-C(2))-methylthiotransferase MtaB [bacterium]